MDIKICKDCTFDFMLFTRDDHITGWAIVVPDPINGNFTMYPPLDGLG